MTNHIQILGKTLKTKLNLKVEENEKKELQKAIEQADQAGSVFVRSFLMHRLIWGRDYRRDLQ